MKINSENLKLIRIKRGLTQTQLADLSNVTQGMISQIEQQTRGVTTDTIERIASVLGCTVEQLSDGGEPTPFVRLIRNCKSLTEGQIHAVNTIVCALIAKKWIDK